MWQTLKASILWTNNIANQWLKQQYQNENSLEKLKQHLRPKLGDFNIQQLFQDFQQANNDYNFKLIRQQLKKLLPILMERSIESYMRSYITVEQSKYPNLNLVIENCTKISIDKQHSYLNCSVALTLHENVSQQQQVNKIITYQLHNDCNPFRDGNVNQCFIDSSYGGEPIILKSIENLNVQWQNVGYFIHWIYEIIFF